jgi:hypothetical protein
MKIKEVFLIILTMAVIIVLTDAAFADSMAKVHKDDADTLIVESGGAVNMKAGSQLQAAGSVATPIANAALVTLNPTLAPTEIAGAVNNLASTQNQILTALRGVGILPTPSPTATRTPTATPTP